jgi:hypothetical protein
MPKEIAGGNIVSAPGSIQYHAKKDPNRLWPKPKMYGVAS